MKKKFIFLGILCIPLSISSQTGMTTSSKNISSTNGSVNYSIGQVFYQSQSGSEGELSTGVQIPVETLTLSTSDAILLRFSAKVYPNPTVKDVYIKLDNVDNSELSYQLFNVNGILIDQSKSFLKENTKISMKHLPANIYMLQVKSKNKTLKTYKIIKNH